MNGKLHLLALHCHNGACNVRGILGGLAEALDEVNPGTVKDNVDLKVIVGQVSYLLNEGPGPREETLRAFAANCETPDVLRRSA